MPTDFPGPPLLVTGRPVLPSLPSGTMTPVLAWAIAPGNSWAPVTGLHPHVKDHPPPKPSARVERGSASGVGGWVKTPSSLSQTPGSHFQGLARGCLTAWEASVPHPCSGLAVEGLQESRIRRLPTFLPPRTPVIPQTVFSPNKPQLLHHLFSRCDQGWAELLRHPRASGEPRWLCWVMPWRAWELLPQRAFVSKCWTLFTHLYLSLVAAGTSDRKPGGSVLTDLEARCLWAGGAGSQREAPGRISSSPLGVLVAVCILGTPGL